MGGITHNGGRPSGREAQAQMVLNSRLDGTAGMLRAEQALKVVLADIQSAIMDLRQANARFNRSMWPGDTLSDLPPAA